MKSKSFRALCSLLLLFPTFLCGTRSPERVSRDAVRKAESSENIGQTEFNSIVTSVDSRILNLQFYELNSYGKRFILADTSEKNLDRDPILIRLFTPEDLFDFNGVDLKSSDGYVLQIQNLVGREIRNSFYVPSDSEVESILSRVQKVSKGSERYSRLVSSLSAANSLKRMMSPETQIQPMLSSANTFDGDNQAILDQYLDTFAPDSNEVHFLTSSGEELYRPGYSDPIVNLIPESYFYNNGTHYGQGLEWGFYLNTYWRQDGSSDHVASLLIYDIENIHADSRNPDVVIIKNVLSYDYVYSQDTSCLYASNPNSYCLGINSYEDGIQYVDTENSQSHHPNPGDSDYRVASDEGFTIGSHYTYVRGSQRERILGSGIAEAVSYLFKGLSIVASRYVGSTFSPTAGKAAGLVLDLMSKAADLISQAAEATEMKDMGEVDKSQQYSKKLIFRNEWNPEKHFTELKNNVYQQETPNADPKRKLGFFKSVMIDIPKYKNTDIPMLLKDDKDYLTTMMSIEKSEESDDYYALINHRYNATVFDEGGLFSNPKELYTFDIEWSYFFNSDYKPATASIVSPVRSIDPTQIRFGDGQKQSMEFTPSVSGYYDIVFNDVSDAMVAECNGVTGESGSYATTISELVGDSENDYKYEVDLPSSRYIKLYPYLTANRTYEITIYRKRELYLQNPHLISGYCTMNIYFSGTPFETMSDNGSGSGMVSTSASYGGFPINQQFLPQVTDSYTFSCSPSKSAETDYGRIAVLNSDFELVYRNVYGGFLNLNMNRGEVYYVIAYSVSPSVSSLYTNAIRARCIPFLRYTLEGARVYLDQYYRIDRMYLLVRSAQTWSTTISIQIFGSDPYPSFRLGIYAINNSRMAYTGNLMDNPLSFTFNKGALYYMVLSSTNLNCTGAYLILQ